MSIAYSLISTYVPISFGLNFTHNKLRVVLCPCCLRMWPSWKWIINWFIFNLCSQAPMLKDCFPAVGVRRSDRDSNILNELMHWLVYGWAGQFEGALVRRQANPLKDSIYFILFFPVIFWSQMWWSEQLLMITCLLPHCSADMVGPVYHRLEHHKSSPEQFFSLTSYAGVFFEQWIERGLTQELNS